MEYSDDWKKFGDRVGWRRDGHWLSTADLTYDPEKLTGGEFPAFGVEFVFGVGGGGSVGVVGWFWFSLLSRKSL